MNPKTISQEDLALFAMQLLTPEESAEILTHLEHNESSRLEFAHIQGDLAAYALSAELHSPPAMARDRLMRRVAKEKKLVPISRPAVAEAGTYGTEEEPLLLPRGGRVVAIDEPSRRSAGLFSWAGWAVAAGLGVAAGLQFHQRQLIQNEYSNQSARLATATVENAKAEQVLQTLSGAGAMEVAMHLNADSEGPAPAEPTGHAAYVADTGSLVFVGTHMKTLPAYKTYELWVIPADGYNSGPVPAGTFKPDERGYASVVLPEMPKGVPAKMFGITIEDDGGSTKGPTLPIVMAGL